MSILPKYISASIRALSSYALGCKGQCLGKRSLDFSLHLLLALCAWLPTRVEGC